MAVAEIVHVIQVEPLAGPACGSVSRTALKGRLIFRRAWRGVFAPLQDQAFFAQVKLDQDLGTIVWPNGADIAPETLHRWIVESGSPCG